MGAKSFEEIRDYYYCILKIRLGVEDFNAVLKDESIDEMFHLLKHKYESISQLPNHIHIISLLNKFRNNRDSDVNGKNRMLLRSIFLLSKFQFELNSDFNIKSESEMINVLTKIVNEYEQLNLYSKDA